jgi:uncharacterized protein YbjQ (UPF0145 family)
MKLILIINYKGYPRHVVKQDGDFFVLAYLVRKCLLLALPNNQIKKMDNKDLTSCPNCGQSLKGGLLSSNALLDQWRVDLIKEYSFSAKDAYCSKCGKDQYLEAKDKLTQERKQLNSAIEKLIVEIPIVSIHSPLNWIYDVKGLVTGQSTTGTGVFSEFKSSFTDFFGAQSDSYNSKLRGGEDLCKIQLRAQALSMGANAIVAVDIDYSEVGGDKGMLMVCMTGTAISLKNHEILGAKYVEAIKELEKQSQRLGYLSKYVIPSYDNF